MHLFFSLSCYFVSQLSIPGNSKSKLNLLWLGKIAFDSDNDKNDKQLINSITILKKSSCKLKVSTENYKLVSICIKNCTIGLFVRFNSISIRLLIWIILPFLLRADKRKKLTSFGYLLNLAN